MAAEAVGKVLAIALRGSRRGPMREVLQVVANADGGLEGDIAVNPQRGITLLASKQWEQVRCELDAELPWHTRRANVLIESGSLAGLVGRQVRIGPVVVEVRAETAPCGAMDRQYAGLRRALEPECRGGVYGRIVQGGTIRIGDEVLIEEP